jgi:hypothetical protein
VDNPAAHQIIALLEAGQDVQARALFMQHLVAHCRRIDQAVGEMLGQHPATDEHLWQVFQGVYRLGWFSLSS